MNDNATFYGKLDAVLPPATVHQFRVLFERDGQGWDLAAYFDARVEQGVEARKRSLEYSEKMARLKAEDAKRERNIHLFSQAVVQNPSVLQDKDKLLTLAGQYDVPVSEVLAILSKAQAAKQAPSAKTA